MSNTSLGSTMAVVVVLWSLASITAAGQQGQRPASLGGCPTKTLSSFDACAMGKAKGFDPITTEILPAPEFYFAEDYHQQYLAKNPRGYCGLGGTGVSCPIGTGVSAA